MITTINRMNADPQFANPFPSNETANDDGTYSFKLTVSTACRPTRRAQTAEVLR